MENFSKLIEQYDLIYKEIQDLQTVFSRGLLFNEGLMANLGKAWNTFKQDSRFDKYTKKIQNATKADDEKVKLALEIVKRKLESRQKTLEKVKKEIEGHNDPELVKRLSQAMSDNQKQAQSFIKAADDMLNTIYPKTPAAAPTAPAAAPAASPTPAASTTPTTPPPAAASTTTTAPPATTKKPSGRRASKKATTAAPVSQKDADKDMDTQTADPNQRGSDKENPELEEGAKK